MAEDKKTFIAYGDWQTQLDLLSDDEAGKLFRHLLSYVNDENPEFSPEDRLLKMAFEPMRKQLVRDLESYKEVKKKRSEAGRSGGLKSGETRSKSKQNEAKEANALNTSETEANEAVNDNGNVNDSVIVNNILLEKESKEKKIEKKVSDEFVFDETDKQPDTPPSRKVPAKEVPPDEESFTKREFRSGLLELGALPRHVDDWFKVRDKRRAPYTRTAFDGFVKECSDHNYPVADAVRVCGESNWQGFKYSWLQNQNNGKSTNHTGASGNDTRSEQATYNIQAAAERLADDFAKGNIPGVYR